MELADIKIGQSRESIRKAIRGSHITMGPFPSFVSTSHLIVEDHVRNDKVYILFHDNLVSDITKDIDSAVNWKKSRETLNLILDEVGS